MPKKWTIRIDCKRLKNRGEYICMGKTKEQFFDKATDKQKEKIIRPFIETLDILVTKMLEQNIAPREFLALYILAIPSKKEFQKMDEENENKK